MTIINAPFSPKQVRDLNLYQQKNTFHPYTCSTDGATLFAAEDGWHCPDCNYTQIWAHTVADLEVVNQPVTVVKE